MKNTLFVIQNNGKLISDPHRWMILLLPWELRPLYGSWAPTSLEPWLLSFTLKSLSQSPKSINSKGLLGYGMLCLTPATSCRSSSSFYITWMIAMKQNWTSALSRKSPEKSPSSLSCPSCWIQCSIPSFLICPHQLSIRWFAVLAPVI